MDIPIDALSEDTLLGVIESFVMREGTDYGEVEAPLSEKVRQVRAQLEGGLARLTFDEATETVNIVPADGPAAP